MNVLPHDKQCAIIAALCEGVSLRSVSRLLDVHRDSAMRLGVNVGQGCTAVHGIVDKQTVFIAGKAEDGHEYVKETLVKVERTSVSGAPRHISTSFIERQNLTLRQSQRRLTRLTNGFSKKYENHCAAIALYATYYNFCRVHETLRITPAMHLGVTDHVWSVSELVQAALSKGAQMQVKKAIATFRVIPGGKQ